MKKFLSFIIIISLNACVENKKSFETENDLPENLKEISGTIYIPETDLVWSIQDSGNENIIYGLNSKYEIEKSITIENTENIDWEDITKDQIGNIYIGDFGNNDNDRKDLCIYKIDKNALDKQTAIPSYKVSFYYREQTEFPPKKKNLIYDVEGFFEFKNNFYLFTKNRSKNMDGSANLYKIPNIAGTHEAQLMGKLETCSDYQNCAITSVAISPDQKTVVVLSHSKIWTYSNFENDDFLNGIKSEINLNHFSQKEAVCFKDNKTLLIADEKSKKTGGKIYEYLLN